VLLACCRPSSPRRIPGRLSVLTSSSRFRRMQLSFSVRWPPNEALDVCLPECALVKDLKQHIQQDVGFSCAQQRLIYLGRLLADNDALNAVGCAGSVVHLVLRPPEAEPQPTPPPRALSTGDSRPEPSTEELLVAAQEFLLVVQQAQAELEQQAQPRRVRRSSAEDFMLGVAVGLIAGFPVVFCMLEPSVPHRLKVALVLGLICNLVLSAHSATRSVASLRRERDGNHGGLLGRFEVESRLSDGD